MLKPIGTIHTSYKEKFGIPRQAGLAGNIARITFEPEYDDENVRAEITASAEGMRYWAMQFGTVCEVMEPESLRDRIKEDIKAIYNKYCD